PHRALPSFPTRRSSDLPALDQQRERVGQALQVFFGVAANDLQIALLALFELRPIYGIGQGKRAHLGPVGPRTIQAVRARKLSEEDRKSTRLNSSHVKIS